MTDDTSRRRFLTAAGAAAAGGLAGCTTLREYANDIGGNDTYDVDEAVDQAEAYLETELEHWNDLDHQGFAYDLDEAGVELHEAGIPENDTDYPAVAVTAPIEEGSGEYADLSDVDEEDRGHVEGNLQDAAIGACANAGYAFREHTDHVDTLTFAITDSDQDGDGVTATVDLDEAKTVYEETDFIPNHDHPHTGDWHHRFYDAVEELDVHIGE